MLIAMAVQAKKQGLLPEWVPKVGDMFQRKYTIFGEPVDSMIWKEEDCIEICIISYKSQIDGYWSTHTPDGVTRIYKHPADELREHCVFIPRQEDIQGWTEDREEDLPCRVNMLYRFEQWIGQKALPMTNHTNGVYFSNLKCEPFRWNELITIMWLAFYMHETHKLKWDGEAWV